MNPVFKFIYLSIVILFSGYTSFAQPKESYSAQIDSLLQTTSPRTFNGVVVVAQNGRILYSKASGYADADKKTPLKISDRFSTMSVAKQITAALILLEVEKGTIDLHTPIRKYLPRLKYSWADTVTVHHLLNNTSGLHSEYLDVPLKFTPGQEFSYSNVGYALAGQILEKQSGKSYQQLVTELFEKCGMTESAYPSKKKSALLVKGHTISKDGKIILKDRICFKPAQYAGSHLMVTASDLVKWNNLLHNGKILQPASYDLMVDYKVTATHQLFHKEPIGYGYGLRINNKEDFREIGHTGFHPSEGFTAVNLYYPETNTSVIVLENHGNENFDIAYHFEQETRKIILHSDLVRHHPTSSLEQKINEIISSKKADIGVSVIGPGNERISINGDKLYPMLSTVKFPIALAILHQVEKGKLSMDQIFFIKKEELLENTWSPFRTKYPEGNISITLSEAVKWMVSYSDNNITDILLRYIGGPEQVENFISNENFIVKNNEKDMHQSWESQFINQVTPNLFSQMLKDFSEQKLLNKQHTEWLYQVMVENKTGANRLKGKLPDVVVAHRTGSSFTNSEGITGAINDIGIIELPNRQKIYITVLVRDTSEEFSKGEEIIADIAKVVYDYFLNK